MAAKHKHAFRIWAISATFLVSLSTTADAFQVGGLAQNPVAKRPGLFLVTKRPTIAPVAFTEFCDRTPDQCARRGSSDTVELTKEKRLELQRINANVNTAIAYVNDADDDDKWEVNPTSGDCEDYALTKRQRLLRAGWPSASLRIATATTFSGIGHAVLVVSTSEGDLVLDNRTNVVKPWKALDLKWIKIQSKEDPRLWVKL